MVAARLRPAAALLAFLAAAGCGSGSDEVDPGYGPADDGDAAVEPGSDGGRDDAEGALDGSDGSDDATADASDGSTDGDAGADAGPGRAIEHVLVIVQENHTFDTYFGTYCTAAAGSNPTCTDGPACCEAAPAKEPSGASPVSLDDAANAAYDPDHTQPCELAEAHDGAMDRYVTGASCSDPRNFAISPESAVSAYRDLAADGALADRYFQSISGATSANDMYFAVAKAEFVDNALRPDSVGKGCNFGGKPTTFEGRTTIADLLLQAGHDFAFYAEGYDAMKNAVLCPLPPADCPLHLPVYPCNFDPSDIPFEYYAQFQDEPAYMRDYAALAGDLSSGALPTLTFVKGLGYHTEHPGYGTRISDGTKFVKSIVDAVAASPVAASTLVLVTWDEGGGYFDHVAPPPTSAVDSQPYGTRVPLIAVGPFARKNHVSHVPMEHSSIVRFVERAFLGATGQLGARDAVVEDIGSLLDPAKTSLATP